MFVVVLLSTLGFVAAGMFVQHNKAILQHKIDDIVVTALEYIFRLPTV